MTFSAQILSWYKQHKRDLPWRTNQNPYAVWLSEVILQQTRVEQGTPYFLRFIERFPELIDLASASEDEVLKLWQGLGYYSRARHMLATAQTIQNEYDGQFPTSAKELIKLKGIGAYTAAAIASICFNEPVAVVDGNVYRVLARYFGETLPINSTEGIKRFKALAQMVMDEGQPGAYNQGLMEFGALQCTPKIPNCTSCVLNDSCSALATKMVDKLPVKLKKTKVITKYFNYVVVIDSKECMVLQQRTGNGIWKGLYEFPLFETSAIASEDQLVNFISSLAYIKNCDFDLSLYNSEPIIHKLSHRLLLTQFWILRLNYPVEMAVENSQLTNFAVPVLIANFLKAFKNY